MEPVVLRGTPPDPGYGDGSGYGYGYGYGSGYGSGSGSGDGYGYGYGYGDGSGSGSGYGYGYGYGSGYGSGSGYGYWKATIPAFVTRWPEAQRARVDAVVAEGATLAFWRSDREGKPANGGRGGARKTGDVEHVKGPLRLCGPNALHATLEPFEWEGPKVWIVALFGEVQTEGRKVGALHREILGVAWTE